jgi:cation-transporting ATPase E
MESCQPVERLHPSATNGLSAHQVEDQVHKGLVNRKQKDAGRSNWDIVRDNAFTLFNLFNVSLAVAVFLVGAYRNLLFMALIAINTLIGIVQEIRSKQLVDRLKLISQPKVTVVRDAKQALLAVEQLVLDDVMILEAGRQIGADAVVLQGEIEVNEAFVTGESEPLKKGTGDELLSGSFVVSGMCYAKVEHVGSANYAATIEAHAKRHKRIRSELLETLDRIVKFTGLFIIPLGAVMLARSLLFLKLPLSDAVVTTVAALIGMMPRGLVLLTSMSLAVGVIKLGRRKTLVNELFGIETLSRVDMLCLDKTGTLTRGSMSVSQVLPQGDATMEEIQAEVGAFLAAQTDSNATIQAIRQRFEACFAQANAAVVPFSSARKWSAVSIGNRSLVMGAPDVLYPHTGTPQPDCIAAYEDEGARVILFAKSGQAVDDQLPGGLTPLCIVVLRDPLRDDAREILNYFDQQGVAIRLISGDSVKTLRAIAKQAGVREADKWIDLSAVTDEDELKRAALAYTVFGRAKPGQKRVIIDALKQAGHTVAMVGDGVNDVLALRDADCSIAMASGTDAARTISQIVLLGDDFAALPAVVNEGRRVVNNITRTASLYLVKTVYSFLLAFVTVIFGIRYPFIPIQLTLIGVLMEGIPSFVLTLEPDNRRIGNRFFESVLSRAVPSGLVIATLVSLAHAFAPRLGIGQHEIATVCTYLTAIFCAILLFIACQPIDALRGSLFVAMTGLFFVAANVFAGLFNLLPLTGSLLVRIVLLTAVGLILLYGYTIATKKSFALAQRRGHQKGVH